MNKVEEWLESGKYLPPILRDFHDQKNIFKSMHFLFQGNEGWEDKPNWIHGQCYVIDWFLWFMARRGYTLQKTRKKLDFAEIPDYRKLNPITFLNKP